MSNPATITMGSQDWTVYGDRAFVDEYMLGAVHSKPWDDTDEATKQKVTINATRLLDRQKWIGSKTVASQTLEFPRTGLTDIDGVALADDELPQELLDGFCELCLSLVDGSDVQTSSTTEPNVASLKAGSVSISYWRSAGSTPGRFPMIVQELLGRWLSGQSATVSATASGTDGCSAFVTDYSISEGI